MDLSNEQTQSVGREETEKSISKMVGYLKRIVELKERKYYSNKQSTNIEPNKASINQHDLKDLEQRLNCNEENIAFLKEQSNDTENAKNKTKKNIRELKDMYSDLEIKLEDVPSIYEFNQQKKKIRELEKNLNNVTDVLSQLLSGLFCHKTQRGALDAHLSILQNIYDVDTKYDVTSKYGYSPTTEQGEANEKRIDVLEKLVAQLTNKSNINESVLEKKSHNIDSHSHIQNMDLHALWRH